MKQQLINKYNQKNSLIVISGYPKKKEKYSQGVCAVSSFAKNTLTALKKENPDRKMVVFTMQIDKPEIYEEDGILIVRCMKRNNPLSYVLLAKEILKFNKIKDYLIEFEFASFGNTIMTGLLSPIVWALSLMGKNVNLVIHQVVTDIKELSGHIGISSNSIKVSLFNNFLKLFYFTLAFPAKRVIVLEEEFKTRLSKLIKLDKITVIPHGVDKNISNTNKNMRKKFGIKKNEFVILYFGYLTWYKGVDFIINALKNTKTINGRKIRLVIAGGPSFTQEEKVHYQKFLSKVKKEVKNSKNAILTGFVKENDITPIFNTADLAVFPYRTFMSSSGPLSLAVSHNKPFILSENLNPLTNSLDIKRSLITSSLEKEDIVFKLNKKDLVKTISNSMNLKTHKKMILFSKLINEERSFAKLAKDYDLAIHESANRARQSYAYDLLTA